HVVLIADDDPVILELLKATLRSDAFRLYTATDGETALNIARSVRPSLILLDWLMPGLDGTDVTRALRAESDPYFRDVPIVLITAEASAAKTQEGFAAGVTDYLTKPFKAPFVRARVRAWLARGPTACGRGTCPCRSSWWRLWPSRRSSSAGGAPGRSGWPSCSPCGPRPSPCSRW